MCYIFYYCKNTRRLCLIISRLSKAAECRKVSDTVFNSKRIFIFYERNDVNDITYDLSVTTNINQHGMPAFL